MTPDGCCPSTKSVCDDAVIGYIHRNMLQDRGSILPRSASDIDDSVQDLASWLFAMMSSIPTLHMDAPHDDPLPCYPRDKFRNLNQEIHESIPKVVASFLKPSQKAYMAKQREKTGLVARRSRYIWVRYRRYWPLN